jgi:ABC-2 type transport system permease protein
MSWPLFRKILRDLRWPFLGTAFLLVLFETLWVKITDRVTKEVIPAILAKIPKKDLFDILFRDSGKLVQAVLGGESIDLSDTGDLLSVGYVHPLPTTLLLVWALGRGAGALAGELERGTMELLVAQPIARWRIVMTHLCVDLVTIPSLALCMWLGTLLGAYIVPLHHPHLYDFWKGVVLAASLGLALTGLTLTISSLGRSRWRVLAWAIALALVMSLLNILGHLWDVLTPYRPLSIFYYYQPQTTVLKDQWTVAVAGMQVPTLAVLLGVPAAGYGFATWRFTRRDLPAPL